MKKKRISVFGSTGSIGTSTLNVIRNNINRYEIVTLVARKNINILLDQIEEFNPKNVYIYDKENADIIKKKHKDINIYYGEEGLNEISLLSDFDIAVCALSGIAGLKPTYNLIQAHKTIALANKEVLVVAGNIIMKEIERTKTKLISIDSEHSAISQCLNGENNNKINKILLTASGGPFLNKSINDSITIKDALNHPNWNMGNKITIDSSTMMNKGFEIIEAIHLFKVELDQIEVVIHKESYIHSMVEFVDGTIIASIGPKSMEIPISYALSYPKRIDNNINKLNLFDIKNFSFQKPDLNKFKCLDLTYKAIKKGHSSLVVLNSANEVLVEMFLNRKIKYTDIAYYIKKAIDYFESVKLDNIDLIIKYDEIVRKKVIEMVSMK